MQPLIGITGSIIERNNNRYIAAYEPNAKAIIRAGGLPIVIPCDLDPPTLRAIYERVDGILLPGGGDIAPEFYGATPHEKTDLIIRERDIAEIQIAKWAVADDLPIFGICRGHQVFNVAMGGTLYQDIPSQIQSEFAHDIEKGMPRNTLLHDVKIIPNSKLAQILKTEKIRVNSLHHQSVMKPAPNVKITAYAPDGVIEASELPDKHFVVTVQWHPEDLQEMGQMRDLFKAFVDAARQKSRPHTDGTMNGKIGVFDSGVGGLSVLREIHRLYPYIPTIYVADQKNIPYGSKSHDQILGFVSPIVDFFIQQGAEVIVLACHAASAAALYPLRRLHPSIPFVGIEPAVKPAIRATKTGVIGVLTTQATADGQLYRKVLDLYAQDAYVITQIAPRLVTLVESGEFSTEAGREIIHSYIQPLLEQHIDQLVLACTHFPFLTDEIARLVGDRVTLVDPGLPVAKQVGRVLPTHFIPASTPHVYFTTGDTTQFQQALYQLIQVDSPAQKLIV